MRIVFLDFDGVINSQQSCTFWHNKRDQKKWENELYKEWQGSLKEYLAQEFCPIALSNMEHIMRSVPDLKIVVSSTWRLGETVESLKQILSPAKVISEAIIDVTPRFLGKKRGEEIRYWLSQHKDVKDVKDFVIIDDDSDMLELCSNLFRTNNMVGLDMIKANQIINYFNSNPNKQSKIRLMNRIHYKLRDLRFTILYPILGAKKYWELFE